MSNNTTLISLPHDILQLIVLHLLPNSPGPSPEPDVVVTYTKTLVSSVFPFALTCRKACSAVRVQLAPDLHEVLHHCSATEAKLPDDVEDVLLKVGAAAAAVDKHINDNETNQIVDVDYFNGQQQIVSHVLNSESVEPYMQESTVSEYDGCDEQLVNSCQCKTGSHDNKVHCQGYSNNHDEDEQIMQDEESDEIDDDSVYSSDNEGKTQLSEHTSSSTINDSPSTSDHHTQDSPSITNQVIPLSNRNHSAECRRRRAWLSIAAPGLHNLSISFLTYYHSPSEAACTVSAFIQSKVALKKIVMAPLISLKPSLAQSNLVQLLEQSSNSLTELQIPLGVDWTDDEVHTDDSMLKALHTVSLTKLKTLILFKHPRNIRSSTKNVTDKVISELLMALTTHNTKLISLHLQNMDDEHGHIPSLDLVHVAPTIRNIFFDDSGSLVDTPKETLRGYDNIETIRCWSTMSNISKMQSVVQKGYFPNLKQVSYYNMYSVEFPRSIFLNGGKKNVIHFGSFIKHLDVYNGGKISSKDVQYLTTDCPNLEVLTIRIESDAVEAICNYIESVHYLKHFQLKVSEREEEEDDDDENENVLDPDHRAQDADQILCALTASKCPFESIALKGVRGSVDLGIELLKKIGKNGTDIYIPLHSTANVENNDELDFADCWCVLQTAEEHCTNLRRLYVGVEEEMASEISCYIVEAKQSLPLFDGNSFLDSDWEWDSILEKYLKDQDTTSIVS